MVDEEMEGVKEAAKTISRMVNSFGIEDIKEAFAEEVRRDHRTLQQNFMRCVLALVERWAEDHDAGMYDLRNEDTCRISRKIVDALGDDKYLAHV